MTHMTGTAAYSRADRWSSQSRRSISRLVLGIGVAAAASALFVLAPTATAQQASTQPLSCSITQITNSSAPDFGYYSSIDGDGIRIAFESSADLTGGNPEGNREIFLYNTELNVFTQIAEGYGPSISANGTRIAFGSGDLTSGPQIFLYAATAGSLTQVMTGGYNFRPSINADGTRIAFEYDSFPIHGISVYDTTTDSVTQLTTAGGNEPAINADGTRIAFVTFTDLTPPPPPPPSATSQLTGSTGDPIRQSSLLLYDTATETLTELAHTTSGQYLRPSINADGTRVAFSFLDFDRGNSEIFLYDATRGDIAQITFTSRGDSNYEPSIGADGTRIAFTSNANLTGGNRARDRQVFLYDMQTGRFTQLTYAESSAPSINGDGTRIVFTSAADHIGRNPDGSREVFLASCLPGQQKLPRDQVQVYPISAYEDLVPSSAFDQWIDPASGNAVAFDTYGKLNRAFNLGLDTSVTGNVTVRDLGNGAQQVVIHVRTTEGACWGMNENYEPAFGYDPVEILFGAPAAVGRGDLRITQRPQPVGPIRRSWPIQSIIGNVSCEGLLRAGSGYPEGTPGIAQTTQTGLYNTGVPGRCPPEQDVDCFPAEQVQFKPRGSGP
jgi:Tol biopolymer transport system component